MIKGQMSYKSVRWSKPSMHSRMYVAIRASVSHQACNKALPAPEVRDDCACARLTSRTCLHPKHVLRNLGQHISRRLRDLLLRLAPKFHAVRPLRRCAWPHHLQCKRGMCSMCFVSRYGSTSVRQRPSLEHGIHETSHKRGR